MKWVYNDGGRDAAGYKGKARDCVTRAVAIAANLNYGYVYSALNKAAVYKRRDGAKSYARTGVFKPDIRRFMQGLGWKWTPTMRIGSGCQVHLREGELPAGRLVVSTSRHLVAVIDGVIHDTLDCSRSGSRCVYGYWSRP